MAIVREQGYKINLWTGFSRTVFLLSTQHHYCLKGSSSSIILGKWGSWWQDARQALPHGSTAGKTDCPKKKRKNRNVCPSYLQPTYGQPPGAYVYLRIALTQYRESCCKQACSRTRKIKWIYYIFFGHDFQKVHVRKNCLLFFFFFPSIFLEMFPSMFSKA